VQRRRHRRERRKRSGQGEAFPLGQGRRGPLIAHRVRAVNAAKSTARRVINSTLAGARPGNVASPTWPANACPCPCVLLHRILDGQLICYVRAVVEDEWQTMREPGERPGRRLARRVRADDLWYRAGHGEAGGRTRALALAECRAPGGAPRPPRRGRAGRVSRRVGRPDTRWPTRHRLHLFLRRPCRTGARPGVHGDNRHHHGRVRPVGRAHFGRPYEESSGSVRPVAMERG
jgi:hypothetical protein